MTLCSGKSLIFHFKVQPASQRLYEHFDYPATPQAEWGNSPNWETLHDSVVIPIYDVILAFVLQLEW